MQLPGWRRRRLKRGRALRWPAHFRSWLRAWRGIALVHTVSKLWDPTLQTVMGRSLRALPAPISGVRWRRQPLQVIARIALALTKAAAWRLPRWVASLHARSVVDCISPAVATDVLREHGAHPAHIAVAVANCVGVSDCPPEDGSDDVQIVGGALHPGSVEPVGGAGARGVASQIVCADDAAVSWIGAAADSGMLIWADDLLLLSHSPNRLQCRRDERAPVQFQSALFTESLEFFQSLAADVRCGFHRHGTPQEMLASADSLWVPGVGLDERASTEGMVAFRFQREEMILARLQLALRCADIVPGSASLGSSRRPGPVCGMAAPFGS